MSFDALRAFHIIFVVSWFAGLFYMVRLLIYHTEAQSMDQSKKEILSEQFTIMEKRLWWVITTPAMIFTIAFGYWMLAKDFEYYLNEFWMQIKLAFVFMLVLYHFYTQRIMFQIHKGEFGYSSKKLRLWNELATFFLVAIVFLVVLKNGVNWIYGTLGFFTFGLLLFLAVRIVQKLRA